MLRELGEIARSYGLAGAVQHGASTLPDELFHRFPAVETAEIHLATGFQNTLYEHPAFPRELLDRISAWCVVNAADERKADQTEEQFLYTTRKKAIGPFKRALWDLETKDEILAAQSAKVAFLFTELARERLARAGQPVRPSGRGPPAAARGPPGRGRGLTGVGSAPGASHANAGLPAIPVRIRLETPADVDGVRAVELSAFAGPEEADIVDRIRREAPEGWHSIVAVGGPGSGIEDLIVGHLLLSPCPVEDERRRGGRDRARDRSGRRRAGGPVPGHRVRAHVRGDEPRGRPGGAGARAPRARRVLPAVRVRVGA